MKIYADENIESAIIEGLRRRTSVLTDRDMTNHIEFL